MLFLRPFSRLYNEDEREKLVANHELQANSWKSDMGVDGDEVRVLSSEELAITVGYLKSV
jgi:hypothetical protein